MGWAGLGWAGLGVGWPSPSGALVRLSFQATSEFSPNIAYQLLHGPTGASFNTTTGQFKWKASIDGTAATSKIAVQVSAQDAVYNLLSTREVLFEIQQESPSCASTTTALTVLFALTAAVIF